MRLRSLPWLNLALLFAIAAAVAVLALRPDGSRGVLVEVGDPRPGIDEVRVDVAGAVSLPGVVVVQPGDRVVDAIELAGGLAEDADTAAINLSRRLVDQDHVVVPRAGERSPLLDVNSASASELESLPGIGPVYASQVIEERRAGGAFIDTDELVERDDQVAHVYEHVRDLIVAR